eukprot:3936789-Rhodomonas_salina.1
MAYPMADNTCARSSLERWTMPGVCSWSSSSSESVTCIESSSFPCSVGPSEDPSLVPPRSHASSDCCVQTHVLHHRIHTGHATVLTRVMRLHAQPRRGCTCDVTACTRRRGLCLPPMSDI